MIRTRDQVYLVYEKSPSEFVTVIGETVVQRQEPIIRDYKVKHRPTPIPDRRAATPALVATSVPAQAVPPDWDENCETWFTEGDSLRPERFYSIRHCNQRDVQQLLGKLRHAGLKPSPR